MAKLANLNNGKAPTTIAKKFTVYVSLRHVASCTPARKCLWIPVPAQLSMAKEPNAEKGFVLFQMPCLCLVLPCCILAMNMKIFKTQRPF